MSTSSFQVSRHIENIFQVILRQFSEDFTTELTRKISSAAPQIGFAAKFYSSKKKLVQQGTSTFHRKQKVSQSDRYLCFVLTVATCNLKMCDPTMPSGYVPKTLFHLFSQPALGVSSTSLQYQKRYPASQHCSNTDNSTICLKTLTPT